MFLKNCIFKIKTANHAQSQSHAQRRRRRYYTAANCFVVRQGVIGESELNASRDNSGREVALTTSVTSRENIVKGVDSMELMMSHHISVKRVKLKWQ